MRFLVLFFLVAFVSQPALADLRELMAREAEERIAADYYKQQQRNKLNEDIRQAPLKQVEATENLKAEVSELRKEVALLRQLLERLLVDQNPQTRKVWKQVRPHIQIEGMIDDGYELVEEPIGR